MKWLARPKPWALPDYGPIPIAYLLALAAAEVTTALFNPLAGIVFHIAILLSLLLVAALNSDQPAYRFYLSLSLAPFIRLLSLSLPLTPFAPIYWYFIISLPLSGAIALVAIRLGFRRQEIGLTMSRLRYQLLIALSGFLLGTIEYTILRPLPLIGSLSLSALWGPALILLFSTGLVEEVAFRGLMQRSALLTFPRGAILYVALVFAILHIGYRSVADLLFVFGVGMFFAYCVKRTDSLLGVTLSHGLTNIMLYLVLPFLV